LRTESQTSSHKCTTPSGAAGLGQQRTHRLWQTLSITTWACTAPPTTSLRRHRQQPPYSKNSATLTRTSFRKCDSALEWIVTDTCTAPGSSLPDGTTDMAARYTRSRSEARYTSSRTQLAVRDQHTSTVTATRTGGRA